MHLKMLILPPCCDDMADVWTAEVDDPASRHGPLTRYVILRVARAPGMPGTFSPPPTSKETAS